MAIDGAQIDVPDSEANLTEFGKAQGGTRRPFPQIRAIGLGECGTHAIVAATLGTIYDGERALAGAAARPSPVVGEVAWRCWD
ncbi:MAG: hypothetical protein ACRDS9_04190 [Pseudonocardiaceae bacterium]